MFHLLLDTNLFLRDNINNTKDCLKQVPIEKKHEKVLHELGLSLSEAITIFLETAVREQRIPFAIAPDPFYSEDNLHYMKQ